MKPGRVEAQFPIQDVGRDRERTVQAASDVRGPVGREKGAPHAARGMKQRIEQNDGVVVQGEAVPKGAEVHDHRSGADDEEQPPSGHAAR